jgi:hypothetical protein
VVQSCDPTVLVVELGGLLELRTSLGSIARHIISKTNKKLKSKVLT